MSQYYRLLNRRGGYTWMQTCATLVSNNKNGDDPSIICVNYVLSEPQHANIVMDCSQINQVSRQQVNCEQQVNNEQVIGVQS